jgi:hypothetical protein
MIGVLKHFVRGVSLKLDDPRVRDALGDHLQEWLEIAGIEFPKPAEPEPISLVQPSPTIVGGSMSQALTERYAERIAGVLSCNDRLVITGPLPRRCATPRSICGAARTRSTGTSGSCHDFSESNRHVDPSARGDDR